MDYSVEVIRSNRRTLAIQVTADGRVVARAPLQMSNSEIRRFMESKAEWIESHVRYRLSQASQSAKPFTDEELERITQKASRIIPERVAYYAPLVGVTYARVTIRLQRTRWGSCSSRGNLNFNAVLVLADSDLMDYVIVHELCHRKQMNHSALFWTEVERVCPNWRECRRRLVASGLLARIPRR